MIFTVTENAKLVPNVYRMKLMGNTEDIYAPGKFVNIEIDGLFLRRPISICDWDDKGLTIIYKVVGKGTEAMSKMATGTELDMLVGLGNGYDADVQTDAPLLVGGGVGVPPLYGLAKALIARGKMPTVILGFNTASEVFYEAEFKSLGCEVIVTTVDGSAGVKGFATGPMENLEYDYLFTCGPEPMLRAVYKASGDLPGQLSFEERMGCGFGACMGCSCQTLTGNVRICMEGPIMLKEAIKWQH